MELAEPPLLSKVGSLSSDLEVTPASGVVLLGKRGVLQGSILVVFFDEIIDDGTGLRKTGVNDGQSHLLLQ